MEISYFFMFGGKEKTCLKVYITTLNFVNCDSSKNNHDMKKYDKLAQPIIVGYCVAFISHDTYLVILSHLSNKQLIMLQCACMILS